MARCLAAFVAARASCLVVRVVPANHAAPVVARGSSVVAPVASPWTSNLAWTSATCAANAVTSTNNSRVSPAPNDHVA